MDRHVVSIIISSSPQFAIDISSVICSTSVSGLNNPLGLCFSTHFVLLYEVVEEDVVLVSNLEIDEGRHMIIILQTKRFLYSMYDDGKRVSFWE